jgi:toxin YhaV
MTVYNGWRLYAFELFAHQLSRRLGHTLGKTYAHWRRVKKGLPARYRLFFRFGSQPIRIIVYAWLNDEFTLRKTGAKTDVYAAFRRMLSRGEVPTSLEELIRHSGTLGP